MTILLIIAIVVLSLSWTPFLYYFVKRERYYKQIIKEQREIIRIDNKMIKHRDEAIIELGKLNKKV